MLPHGLEIHCVEHAQFRRRPAQRRAQQQVVLGEIPADLPPGELECRIGGGQIGDGLRLAPVVLDARHRLEVVVAQFPAQFGEPLVDLDGHRRRHQVLHRGPERLGMERRRGRLDVMSQLLEHHSDVGCDRRTIRVDRIPARHRRGDADAKLARIGTHLVDVRANGRRDPERRAHCRARREIEQQRGVPNTLGDSVFHRQRTGQRSTGRHPAAGRLESYQAVGGRRNPDRTTAVAGVRGRGDTDRDGRARATGRAADAVGEPARVARRTEQHGLGARVLAELRGVRLADDHEPGPPVARHQFGVRVRDPIREQPGAVGRRKPRDVGVKILDQKGDSPQRSVRKPGVHLGECFLGPLGNHRVDGGVALRDPVQRELDHLASRHVTVSDRSGQPGHVLTVEQTLDRHTCPSRSPGGFGG